MKIQHLMVISLLATGLTGCVTNKVPPAADATTRTTSVSSTSEDTHAMPGPGATTETTTTVSH